MHGSTGSKAQQPAAWNSHIPHAEAASYPLRFGNRVTPLIDGEPAFRRICEAVEAARHSVWIAVAFLETDMQMPDGRGSFFDVLDKAHARGLDVRAIFWHGRPESGFPPQSFFGMTDENRDFLEKRRSEFAARWDRAQTRYCHHQKTWLVDAGHESEAAFIGGINLGQQSIVAPGHSTEGRHIHDIYVEVQGPSATDAHHNFVQRWNEASERQAPDGSWPPAGGNNDLPFPEKLSGKRGTVPVQIQRTVKANQYRSGTAAPGAAEFPIHKGEFSVFEQYEKAIAAAKSTIYIEDQALGTPQTVEALHKALERGVDVTLLLPADPNEEMALARKLPQTKPFFDRIGEFGKYGNFLLAGIAQSLGGSYNNIYVHAKVALIDDHWATIGSCNVANRSFFNDTELNASFWDGETVKKFRCNLLSEHLALDTSGMTDREAFALYRRIAQENAERMNKGLPLEGLAFALDPVFYGA